MCIVERYKAIQIYFKSPRGSSRRKALKSPRGKKYLRLLVNKDSKP